MLIFLSIIWHNENKLREARPTPSEITLATGETIEDPIAPPPAICDLPSDPKHPYRLTVPKAEVVNACVRNVGTSEIKNADGTTSYQIQTAKNIHQVGWYNKSNTPDDSGVVFISGHSSPVYRDAVFNYLGRLTNGDEIVLERADGKLFHYVVISAVAVSIEEANREMSTLLTPGDTATLSLVTCSGRWLPDEQTMENRTLIRAKLTQIE